MAKSVTPRIIVKEDYESLSQTAAENFSFLAQKIIREKGVFCCALSGGSTPKRVYEILGAPPYQTELPWGKVHFFFSDERSVPPDHPESNFKMIDDCFFSKIELPDQNIHRMKGELDPEKAEMEYAQEIKDVLKLNQAFQEKSSFPRFDLILLGIGSDGHTASLFPGTAALKEKEKWVTAYYVEKLKMYRISLTFPVINAAAAVAFLVSGSEKAEIVSRVISRASGDELFPADQVQPESGELIWYLDSDAARLVSRVKHVIIKG